jgi:hypothetical protein
MEVAISPSSGEFVLEQTDLAVAENDHEWAIAAIDERSGVREEGGGGCELAVEEIVGR